MDIAIIPRELIARFVDVPERRIHWNVLLSHIMLLAIGMLLSQLPRLLTEVPHLCLFQAITGKPCPGCGVTRSALALLAGDWQRAIVLNPAGLAVTVAIVLQVPLRLHALIHRSWASTAVIFSRTLTVAVLLALIVVWLFRIAK